MIEKLLPALVLFTAVANAQPSPKPDPSTDDEAENTSVTLQSPGLSQRRIAALVIGGVGLAAFGGAVGFDLSARSSYDDSQKDRDPARQGRLIDDFNRKRIIADALVVVGIGAAVTATYLWITGATKVTDLRRVAPLVTPTNIGLAYTTEF